MVVAPDQGAVLLNAGGDADTNAAIACAILGAKFGFKSIPQEYVDGLIYKGQLETVVEDLANVFLPKPFIKRIMHRLFEKQKR